MSKTRQGGNSIPQVAGNGLLDRRTLLGRGIITAHTQTGHATAWTCAEKSLTLGLRGSGA